MYYNYTTLYKQKPKTPSLLNYTPHRRPLVMYNLKYNGQSLAGVPRFLRRHYPPLQFPAKHFLHHPDINHLPSVDVSGKPRKPVQNPPQHNGSRGLRFASLLLSLQRAVNGLDWSRLGTLPGQILHDVVWKCFGCITCVHVCPGLGQTSVLCCLGFVVCK